MKKKITKQAFIKMMKDAGYPIFTITNPYRNGYDLNNCCYAGENFKCKDHKRSGGTERAELT